MCIFIYIHIHTYTKICDTSKTFFIIKRKANTTGRDKLECVIQLSRDNYV